MNVPDQDRAAAAGGGTQREWTPEQRFAIEHRRGDLLIDAGAGSGKTSVLVERFVRMVLDDGVAVNAILTITFTEKAAAELRERIRRRLRELGRLEAARATEGAYISTIHGFCARVLRAHALAAGLDPRFVVLDAPGAERLAARAFATALEELGEEQAGVVELLASYPVAALREAILGVHAELRSRGQRRPVLPPLPPAEDAGRVRARLGRAVVALRAELGAVADPGVRVVQALERLGRCEDLLEELPTLAQLDQLCLPRGNGAALSTAACAEYAEALNGWRRACEHRRAEPVHRLLSAFLARFAQRYGELKHQASAVDFEDLELLARDLLCEREDVRARYRERFAHVMVDELQDTNRVQLELIEALCRGNLCAVGDAQQSIYGFRHADVGLFRQLGTRMRETGADCRLATNFRSRPEILAAVDGAFRPIFGESFMELMPGRADPPAPDPRVELIVVDKASDWESDGLASPWRIEEARVLAGRVAELIRAGAAPREIVLLTRATTDLRAYERALEEQGVPTYVIGGRGYWSHPQVIDVLAYLRALANPRDEEALLTVLASPFLGAPTDVLVLLCAAARASARDPWSELCSPGSGLAEALTQTERAALAEFVARLEAERRLVPRLSTEELIARGVEGADYDAAMLAMPGGRRRLANVRKLMRLAREHEAQAGRDLRGFLELTGTAARDERESEAPVEGEALDAVRLMTIHRAKGLEFPIVCVADLGRMPWRRHELLRIGRDGRFGLRLSGPGTARAEPALDYRALGEEQLEVETQEERRLFYVALTRAQERLIVSGAARLDGPLSGSTPMAWLGPALVPELASPEELPGQGLSQSGVAYTLVRAQEPDARPGPVTPSSTAAAPVPAAAPAPGRAPALPPPPPPPPDPPAPPVGRLSYSALAEFSRCGYRFYVERVLGLPGGRNLAPTGEGGSRAPGALSGAERGTLAHALLERVDFRRPVAPGGDQVLAAAAGLGLARPAGAEAEAIAGLIAGFLASELSARLGRAARLRHEERFTFVHSELLVQGVIDVLARESDGATLIVDYKSDQLAPGVDLEALVREQYAEQRLVYALAALRSGTPRVEVAHVFLEQPQRPVLARYGAGQAPELEQALQALVEPILRRRFTVSAQPHRRLCGGCPAEGILCSWPLSLTRRDSPETLF